MSRILHLKKVEQAAWWTFQQDGLTEILLGVFLAATAGWIHDDGLLVPWILLMVFLTPILEAIRRRFTYPRVGYAELRAEKPAKLLRGIALYTILAIAGMAVALAFFGDRADNTLWGLWRQWSPALAGVLLAGGFIYQGAVSGVRRYRAFVLIAVGLGVAFSLWFPQTYTGVKLYLLTVGGLLVLYGVAALVVFLRRHAPPGKVLDGAG